jgi:hypothetical protein
MSREKRKRGQAGIDRRVPGRDADLPSPSPEKRQRAEDPFADILPPERSAFTAQAVGSVGRPIPPRLRIGREFHQAIQNLREGSGESVSTRFNLRVRVERDSLRISQIVPVGGSFSVFQHTTTGLVQGNLLTGAKSAYKAADENFSVLPRNLSLQRAVLESRAIKQLADSGRGYDAAAKWSQLDEAPLVNEDREISKLAPLGGIALASHLEDITAKRAVGLDHVGSAIRASVLAVKWKLIEADGNAFRGFRSQILSSFPQFGNKKVPAGGLDEGGISALKRHWDAGGTTFSKQDQLDKIQGAHDDASHAAGLRFISKLKALGTSERPGGAWWEENEERLRSALRNVRSGDRGRSERGTGELRDIRREYVAWKFARHGIKND